MCGISLTTKNTGELKWLQPACNKCLPAYALECRHIFTDMMPVLCILCGYENKEKIHHV